MDMVAIHVDEDREDGEIVDDFEDISDCSIPSVGKCDNALLRAISLSSISDSGDERTIHAARPGILPEPQLLDINQHRNTRKRKRKRKRKQHHDIVAKRRYSPQVFVDLVADSSSSTEEPEQDMLRKLKEAVHIEGPNEHNSLRSRLKAMIHNVPQSEDEDIETLRTLALISNSKTEENDAEPELLDILDDRELLELRSAALKSAVLKKHQERKKRKLDNKQTNTEITIATTKQINNTETNKDTSIEEDVDIMRATLLASLSKNITNQIIPIATTSPQQPPKTLNNRIPQPTFTLPPVKPLIIHINNDSDSESDVKSPKKKPFSDDTISQSVTEFLKLRRQQFEATEENNTQSGNPPSNGLLLNRSGDKEAKGCNKGVGVGRDLSGVKLLSKEQQREYQLLKRKLLLAKQKKLVDRIKSSEVKRLECAQKMPRTFKQTLEDLQFRENGRLRVKGKYDSLAGLLLLVNSASVERQRCEVRMKRLLDELTAAKGQLGQAHRKFTGLVQKLIREKNSVDASRFAKVDAITAPALVSQPSPVISVLTSAPVKPLGHESQLTISDIISETNALVLDNGTSEILLVNDNSEVRSNALHELVTKTDEVLTTEPTSCVYTFHQARGSFKYISPLDNRSSTTDPHGTICPYELFGDCKDASCKFVHCGKS